MEVTLALLMTAGSLAILFLIRNEIVFRIRMRRIDWIHERNVELIARRVYSGHYSYDEIPSYDAMLFDLCRWTYAHFFPSEAA